MIGLSYNLGKCLRTPCSYLLSPVLSPPCSCLSIGSAAGRRVSARPAQPAAGQRPVGRGSGTLHIVDKYSESEFTDLFVCQFILICEPPREALHYVVFSWIGFF